MSNKIKKKQLKQVQNQAQEGRSMVEMLGVLAIIGVISIGGIAGYRWGMDKHVSNQILYEMNLNSAQLAMLLQKGNPDGVTLSLGSPYDEGKFRTVDYGFSYACGEEASFGHDCQYLDETMYSMTATGLPKRVCNMLSDAVFGMAYYYDSEINGGDNECNDTGNTVTVFFDTDTTVEGGIPRPEESETHTPAPEVTEPITESTNSECDETCPVMCNAGSKCECPGGSKLSADGSKCECPADKPRWTGTECTTCPEGSQTQNGQCVCNDGTEWKASAEDGACNEERLGECESNADCDPGEYCYLEYGYGLPEFAPNQVASNKFGVGYSDSYTSKCRNVRGDAKEGEITHFVGSKREMSRGSAERFCAALGRPQATQDSVECNGISCWCEDTDGMLTDLKNDFDSNSDMCMWLDSGPCVSFDAVLYTDDAVKPSYYHGYALCE